MRDVSRLSPVYTNPSTPKYTVNFKASKLGPLHIMLHFGWYAFRLHIDMGYTLYISFDIAVHDSNNL